jgi:FkbM family methyltransferase
MFSKALQLVRRLRNYARLSNARLRSHWSHTTVIGRHTIQLPAGHRLDVYRAAHPLYDLHVQHIGAVLLKKYPQMWAVDIGANVGDTAAAISAASAIPTVCVEGDPFYFSWLEGNARRIGDWVRPVAMFVGKLQQAIPVGRIIRQQGTARLAAGNGVARNQLPVHMAPINVVLSAYAGHSFKLMKIDTDGHDFEILCSSAGWIAEHRPVVLFECDTSFRPDGMAEAKRTFELLRELGYRRHVFFDNYGNPLVIDDGSVDAMLRAIEQLDSTRQLRHGVQYFDVYAFHDNDLDLHDSFRRVICSLRVSISKTCKAA